MESDSAPIIVPRPPRWLRLAAILLIGAASMQPLLKGLLPRGADVFLHFYRIIALDDLIRNGVFFSRWFPNLAFGYGYPIFQFYPPLPHYLAEALHLLGLAPINALNGAFVVFACLGALGMYAFARDVFGRVAGIGTAMLYAFAPYTLYNAFERAALAEFAALACVPWALWALRKTQDNANPQLIGLAALTVAGIVLSHNITAMLSVPVLVAYAFVRAIVLRRPSRNTALAIALGLALTTFFWLPAFVERDLTRLDSALSAAYDFRGGFLQPAALPQFGAPTDTALLNSQVDPGLLAAALPLCAIALLLACTRYWQREQRLQVLLAALLAGGAAFMSLQVSKPVWEALPLLRFVLYPSRFLGLASIGVALAAGAILEPRTNSSRLRGALMAALFGVLALAQLSGFFWQQPGFHPANVPQTAETIPAAERRLGIVGTTSIGEYAPIAVTQWPVADAQLIGALRLPANANRIDEQRTPLTYEATVDLGDAGAVVFNQFYFEGWQAQIDGAAVRISPTQPEGLIAIAVPAGRHRVAFQFGGTRLRTLAELLSLATLLLLLGILLQRGAVYEPLLATAAQLQPALLFVGAAALIVGLGAFKHLWVDRTTNPWRAPSTALAQATAQVTFGGDLQLLNQSEARYNAAEHSIDLTVYWRAARVSIPDYSINVRVVDAVGEQILSIDRVHPDTIYPTSRISPQIAVRDVYRLTLPPGTPPGRYSVHLGVYIYGAPEKRVRLDGSGALDAEVAQIDVGRSARTAMREEITGVTPFDVVMTDGVTLAGAALPLKTIRVGEAMPLTLLWSATDSTRAANDVCFEVTDAQGKTTALGCQKLLDAWQTGDVWKVPYRVRLIPQLAGGAYTIAARVADGRAALGTIEIQTPRRLAAQPPIESAQPVTFQDAGALVGFDMPSRARRGEPVTVELVWRATRDTEKKYTAFVHIVNAAGQRVGRPRRNTR